MIGKAKLIRLRGRTMLKLPETLYQRFGSTEFIHLSFGNHSQVGRLCPREQALLLKDQEMAAMLFPLDIETILARYDKKSKRLSVGPIFGLLVSEGKSEDETLPFGTLSPFYAEMAHYCTQKGLIFYILTLSSFIPHSLLTGYRLIKGTWVKKPLPYPDVVYNRLSRADEKKQQAKRLFSFLKNEQIPYFNERFLNKWEVQQILADDPVLAPHLPETILFEKASHVDTMLQTYPIVFAKPISGSLGRGIIKIAHAENGQYYARFSHENTAPQKQYTLLPLLRKLTPLLKSRPYLLQQGIQPFTYNRKPVDFRMLCMKTATGTWEIASIVARCSQQNRFVANIAMGGTLHPPKLVLLDSYSYRETKRLLRLLKELAIHCALTIEQQQAGTYGEFGIDFLIDRHGKPWILEVNTKPSKNDGSISLLRNSAFRPSTKAIAQYAMFLSQFEEG